MHRVELFKGLFKCYNFYGTDDINNAYRMGKAKNMWQFSILNYKMKTVWQFSIS